MSHKYDIPEDDLIKLAGKHDIEPEFRDDFKEAMNSAVATCCILKNYHPVKKEQHESLMKKSQALIKAIDAFEKELVTHPGEPCTNESERYSLKRIDLEALKDIQLCRKKVRANAFAWEVHASIACENHRKQKPGRGDIVLNDLIFHLIDAWAIGGKKVGLSNSNKLFYGPMFRFINDCFDLLGAKKKDNFAMGKSIRRCINQRKKR